MKTLKPEELRIGNYTKNKGVITKIDARSIFDCAYNNEKYYGVEITEQLLEQLGFENLQCSMAKNEVEIFNAVDFFVYTSDKVVEEKIKYIHELQNWYYLDTKQELTLKQ